MSMFCYQCEQTANDSGCTIRGVCGKESETASLQDLLVYAVKGISRYAYRAQQLGKNDHEVDKFVLEALFTTVTNVNFDSQRIAKLIHKAAHIRDKAKQLYQDAVSTAGQSPQYLTGAAEFVPADDIHELIAQGRDQTITRRLENLGEDLTGLQELITYGLKGAAAYACHAQILGVVDKKIYAWFHGLLDFLADNPTDVDQLVTAALNAGELNLKVMELLDKAHTDVYGHPEPTKARITPVRGKCVLVSGHDLKDLEELLRQTEGKGLNVYTHGEMLSCLAYPGLKKYKHLVGNYGGPWQNQTKEFEAFPGAILMTTNCIQKPKDSYKDRIFTCGLVAWPGVSHISDRDFTPVIEAALAQTGFEHESPEKYITIGFARQTIMSVADKVIEAVKSGSIRHFFLIGGCDGAKPGRNYFTEFAEAVPKDCLILTLACGKYRFNKLDFGEIDGIPRLLDLGQCNDAYSAIQVTLALAEAFDTDVNSLPLSLIISWFEQKAVAILLTLLHLGIKNIRLGPTLPAFVSPAVLKVLIDKFNIMPTGTARQDLRSILAN